MQDVFLGRLPSGFCHDFEVLRPVPIPTNAHEHLRALAHMLIDEGVAAHAFVSFERVLALCVAHQNLSDNVVRNRQ